MSAGIFLEEKRRPKPAPSSYQFKQYVGVEGPIKSTKFSLPQNEKFCEFIDQAKWQGGVAPGHKYEKKFNIPDPKPRIALMWKQNEKSTDKRIETIKRDKTKPTPGEYEDLASWKKT